MISTGGEGKVPSRKRLRGKIGNPSAAPELKTHNLLRNDNDTADTFYDSTKIYGVFTNTNEGLWFPIVGKWPVVGSTSHERVGKRIRVKLLRLKGYVGYSPYLITQVRYRIVLYRTKKFDTYSHKTFIVPMYHAFNDLVESETVVGLQDLTVADYYVSFFNKDVLKENDIKRRVIFKGLIQPQPDAPNFKLAGNTITSSIAPQNKNVSTTVTGKEIGNIYMTGSEYPVAGWFNGSALAEAPSNINATLVTSLNQIPVATTWPTLTYAGEFQNHTVGGGELSLQTPANQRGFFPIDITVNMNDNIDCENYDYVFVVEADWTVGQNPSGQFSNLVDRSNFFITFIPHIYYTDD